MDKDQEKDAAKAKRVAATKKTPEQLPVDTATDVSKTETKTDSKFEDKKAETPAKDDAASKGVNLDGKSDDTTARGKPQLKFSKPSRKLVKRTLIGLGVATAAFLIGFGVLIYVYKSDSKVVEAVSGVVPYPAMVVNNHLVSYDEYLFQLGSNKQYYASQASANGQPAVDFNSAAGKKQLDQLKSGVRDQLVSDEVTRQLIRKNKISVTAKEQTDQYNQLVKSAGGEAKLDEVLTKVYGWDQGDLKSQLKFQLLKQKLEKKITSDPKADAQAKAKAEDVLKQINAGGDFATLAKKYSQDTSAADGGNLGFFGKGQMVKEFEDVAFAQEPGKVSGLVKSQYGYHIIRTIEFNADKTQVHAAHILFKPVDFENYLSERVKEAKVTKLVKA